MPSRTRKHHWELTPEQQARGREAHRRCYYRHKEKLTPQQKLEQAVYNRATYEKRKAKLQRYRDQRKAERMGRVRTLPDHAIGFVYLITDASKLVKIGYASDLARRLTVYGTHNPTCRLLACMPGERAIEAMFHHRFRKRRYRPGARNRTEWFALTDDQVIELMQEFADASPDATIATVDADCYPSVRWRR